MTHEEIRLAITARMVAFTGIDKSRIDYSNSPAIFKPPDKGLWCRLNIQYADSFMAGMANKPYTRIPGQIVIQCFARVRTGEKELTMLCDSLINHFAYWSSGHLECLEGSLKRVGQSDTIGNPSGSGFEQFNVHIRFRAG